MVTDLYAGLLLLGPSIKCHASSVRELEIGVLGDTGALSVPVPESFPHSYPLGSEENRLVKCRKIFLKPETCGL